MLLVRILTLFYAPHFEADISSEDSLCVEHRINNDYWVELAVLPVEPVQDVQRSSTLQKSPTPGPDLPKTPRGMPPTPTLARAAAVAKADAADAASDEAHAARAHTAQAARVSRALLEPKTGQPHSCIDFLYGFQTPVRVLRELPRCLA